MTKQEFLAMSFPYDVKVIDKFDCIWTIHPYKDALDTLRDNEHLSYENFIKEEGHKLILRPLSGLNKPIEHKGETFVPSEWFELGDDDNHCFDFGNNNTGIVRELEIIAKHGLVSDINYLPFAVVQKLIEWKFNLMDKSEEFVDVNALETNPYK